MQACWQSSQLRPRCLESDFERPVGDPGHPVGDRE